MHISTSCKLALATVLIGGCISTSDALTVKQLKSTEINVPAMMSRMAPNAGCFKDSRSIELNKANAKVQQHANMLSSTGLTVENPIDPTLTVGPVGAFRDMDGPDGQLWHYTISLVTRPIQHEYYVEEILEEYSFNIYNSNMELVGVVSDKMRYRDDEVRVPGPALGIDLLPVVTKKFFNDDEKYEVVVSIAINTTTEGKNNYRSVAYSIGGEKETLSVYDAATGNYTDKLCDKPVYVHDAFVSDVLDVAGDGSDEFYLTFMHEDENAYVDSAETTEDITSEDGVDYEYWERVKSYTVTYPIYSKVDPATGEMKLVHSFTIPYLCVQGDQEDSPVFVTFARDGVGYLAVPYYKEPFYNPYYSDTDDLTMNTNNSLVIELYQLSPSGANLLTTTEIPMSLDEDNDALFTYYGIGRLRYADDISFDTFSNDGKPSYYVTRSNFLIETDGESDYSFYVYDVNGNLIRTIFEYSLGTVALTDIEGTNPLHAFVAYDEEYTINFVDLTTGYDKNSTVVINKALQFDEDSEAEDLNLTFDRIPTGDGSWKYAFEMTYPTVDDYDNDIMRIAWFDQKGNYDHIDYINMGSNVYYAKPYIDGSTLSPTLFCDDDIQEYMILIKRGIDESDSTTQEELIVSQPQDESNDWLGKTLLYLAPCEKGALTSIGIYPGLENEPMLNVIWVNEAEQYTTDLYALPLVTDAGIDNIINDNLDNRNVDTTIYNLQGIRVGNDFDSLPTGLYIQGGKKIFK